MDFGSPISQQDDEEHNNEKRNPNDHGINTSDETLKQCTLFLDHLTLVQNRDSQKIRPDDTQITNQGNVVPEIIHGVGTSSGLPSMNSFQDPYEKNFLNRPDMSQASYYSRIYRSENIHDVGSSSGLPTKNSYQDPSRNDFLNRPDMNRASKSGIIYRPENIHGVGSSSGLPIMNSFQDPYGNDFSNRPRMNQGSYSCRICRPENIHGVGSSSGLPSMNSFQDPYGNDFLNRLGMNQGSYSCKICRPENIHGVESSSGLPSINSYQDLSRNDFLNQPGMNQVSYSGIIYSPMIPMQNNNDVERNSIVAGYNYWLMKEEMIYKKFQKYKVPVSQQLNYLPKSILQQRHLFFTELCNGQGSNVLSFIRNLKGTEYASTMTRIIATQFYKVMTHPTAKRVIRACLNHLENKANEILYELAIKYFRELAVHEQGCLSLKYIIDTIAGQQKMRLIFSIANESLYLSQDPYGNHVVQHVLALGDDDVNREILSRLKGQFVSLGQKKGGSYVIEKCLESSAFGTSEVVKDILNSPNGPFVLARHILGNYVIQKALKKTKEHCLDDLHRYLLQALGSRLGELTRIPCAMRIVNLIKDEITQLRDHSFKG